ncbi:RIP metalloprotease RseP [Candidatus Peregrinibacteria bacterium]|nr:RIP metalloprotease RseP [Candidatus Peregrinibacteria bacterium]
MGILLSILAFLVIFSLLVLVHEFGHFWAAKREGIKVLEFGLGLPPRIWGKKYGETLYSFNAIPFGGFVRLFGEDPRDKGALQNPRSFSKKGIWPRTKVIVAGVLMNFLLAFILLDIGFSFGIEPLILNGEDVLAGVGNGTIETAPGLLVKSVVPMSSAEKAGIAPGDRLLNFDSKNVSTAEDVFRFLKKSQSKGFQILRNGERREIVFQDISSDPGFALYESFSLPRARVYSVSAGSVTARAGILPMDVILAVNGRQVFSVSEISEMSVDTESVLFTVLRGDEIRDIAVPMGFSERAVITDVLPGSPAQKAGFLSGDRIVRWGGQSVATFEDIRQQSANFQNTEIEILIDRFGNEMTLILESGGDGKIGVVLSSLMNPVSDGLVFFHDDLVTSVLQIHTVSYPLLKAPQVAFSELRRLSYLTVQMFGSMVKKLVGEGAIPEEIAGPVGIAQLTSVFLKEGFLSLMRFTALLSLSLGVMNILPIPALDGGRLLFLIVEIIRGKKANARWETFIHAIGYSALLLLIALVTYNDILRLIRGGS